MHLPRRWLDRRFYEYVAVNLGTRWWRATPILVYQMGRVGSSSVRNALFRSRASQTRLVLMSHEFLPVRRRNADRLAVDQQFREAAWAEIAHARNVFQRLPWRQKLSLLFREKFYSEMIHRNIIARQQPAKVITLVREPIGNNVSMFFQVFGQYADPRRSLASYTTVELIRLFLDHYLHWRPLTWFDVELKAMLGIDVYQQPFPKEKGYVVVQRENVELLVLKCEVPDTVKEQAISHFVGIDDFHVVRSNVTARKAAAPAYARFQQTIRLPPSYVDAMYGSKYARHFYSDAELAAFRRRWQAGEAGGRKRDTNQS